MKLPHFIICLLIDISTVALLIHELLAEIHVDQTFIHLQGQRDHVSCQCCSKQVLKPFRTSPTSLYTNCHTGRHLETAVPFSLYETKTF